MWHPKSKLDASPLKENETTKASSPLVKLASSPVGALAILLGVVLWHESGHYLAARSFGIHPQEFSIGFGPKLLGIKAFGDDFNLRALPLGGYVGFSPAQLEPLPWQQRGAISGAGVAFNLVLAFMIYFIQIVSGEGIMQIIFDPGVLVSAVAESDAAASGVLRPGDVIVSVNGTPVKTSPRAPSEAEAQRAISQIITTIQGTPDRESLEFNIQRPNLPNPIDVTIEPKCMISESTGKPGPETIGVLLQPNIVGVESLKSDSLAEAAGLASRNVLMLTRETAIGLLTLVGDFLSRRKSEYGLSGPIGVIQRASAVVSTQDWDTVRQYAAATSVNFAVVNLLPIPPLGGFQVYYTLAKALWS